MCLRHLNSSALGFAPSVIDDENAIVGERDEGFTMMMCFKVASAGSLWAAVQLTGSIYHEIVN